MVRLADSGLKIVLMRDPENHRDRDSDVTTKKESTIEIKINHAYGFIYPSILK
jgi:hypothetical protein